MEDESHVAKLTPKDPRSKHRYNVFCRLFLCWLDPLFWRGIRKPLEQSDLYVHPEEADSEQLLSRFNRYWSGELDKKKSGGKAYLEIVIFKCLWWRIVLQGVFFFTEMTLFVYQSILLGSLTEYFSLSNPSSNDTVNAYLYATGMVAIALCLALIHAHVYLLAQKLGILARITLTGAIYQKTLQINHTNLSRITTGHVINLASNDVQRFETGFIFIHSLWLNVVMVAIITWLNYREIGPSSFYITACVLLLTPLQLLLARVYTKLRFGSALLTDRRVKIMNEVISGMRVIKMYAWEHAFKRLVDKLRKQEIVKILRAALIRAFNFGVYNVAVEIMLLLAFSQYASGGGVVTPGRVFTVLVLTFYMRLISLLFFTGAVHSVAELRVAVVRIQKLLELGDKEDGTDIGFNRLTRDEQGPEEAVKDPHLLQDHDQHNNSVVLLEHMSASWSLDKNKLSLNNINLEVTLSAPLLAVVGPVGSGKCLLGELKPMEGTVVVKGKISYASQDPWVFSGTVRDNILFGSNFDKSWYHTVVEACALSKDIEQLPHGDFTLVGERGVSLSGGQKARVNLARAVYHRAQVYLLDDPLSAVDTVVARHIFDKCIQGLLRGSIVILVTHQIQFAMQADKILAIKDGAIEAYGTAQDIQTTGINTSILLGRTGDEESLQCIDEEDEEGDNKDNPPDMLVPLEAQIPHAPSMVSLATYEEASEPGAQVQVQAEDSAQGSISTMTYVRYFQAGAGTPLLLFTAAIFIAGEVAIVFSNWWLSDWASCASQNITVNITTATSTCTLDVQQRIGVLAGLTITAVVLSFIRIFLIFGILINGGRILHNRMFSSIMRVPVRFFDTNPSGRILNRFSKDVGFMDDLLTYLYAEFLILILRFLAIIVTAAVANPWMLIAIIIIIVCFLFLRKYFITTSRAIKRLEAIARSPVYSHISMTIQGLSTIRAFGKQGVTTQHYHQYMNSHSQAAYLYLVTNRWFGIRIDLLSAVLLACVAYASVPLTSSFSPSLLALGVTYTSTLAGMFQYCVRLSAEVENTMVSAERVIQYSSLEPEASLETRPPNEKPSPDWPQRGEIILDDVSFRYSKDTPLVLKSLSLIINPAEKVGIVGRTGAGKSSLIALLFRLAEPFGRLVIDGVQITSIGLHDLRSKMSIIPQDPVLFSGSVRYNLDPFDEHQDQQLWDVLEQVQLKATVETLEGGLESQISEGGSNFSVGQRQLVCLARALLRKNKILILDEATANVDLKTDGIIQSAIRESFCDCTVLTIAHRLNTVMDCDKIVVMDAGEIRECGEPHTLLQDPNSLLKDMVRSTGPSASRKLYQIARRRKHSIL